MQVAFPVEVSPQEVTREKTLGGAIALCAKAAGYEPKELQAELKWDKAQWSRWESGQEGVVWPKFVALMDLCGNDAPLFWMLNARGYDLSSLRRQETELEKELRLARELLDGLAELEVGGPGQLVEGVEVAAGALGRLQGLRDEADRLHGADGLAEIHDVADAVLVLEDHEDAGQEVRDEALRAETERDTDHTDKSAKRADAQIG